MLRGFCPQLPCAGALHLAYFSPWPATMGLTNRFVQPCGARSTTFPTELATFEILASCGERQDLIRILNGAQAQEPEIRAFACHALYRLWWGPLVDREAELLDNEASGDVQRLLISSLAKYWTTKSCQTIWQYVESNDNGLRLYALEQLLRSDVGLAFVEERRECVQRLKALADIDIVAVHHSAEVESRRRFWESLEHLALTEEFTSFHSNLSRVDGGRHGSERFCFSVLLFVRSKLEENVTQHRDMYWRVQEFLTPHELGTVTPLIRPVLREFVQHKIPELQFAGCKSLLLFGNLDDARVAAAVAVERLDGSEFGWRLAFLRLLANRFGNNFGFDQARWRTHIDEELSRWGVKTIPQHRFREPPP